MWFTEKEPLIPGETSWNSINWGSTKEMIKGIDIAKEQSWANAPHAIASALNWLKSLMWWNVMVETPNKKNFGEELNKLNNELPALKKYIESKASTNVTDVNVFLKNKGIDLELKDQWDWLYSASVLDVKVDWETPWTKSQLNIDKREIDAVKMKNVNFYNSKHEHPIIEINTKSWEKVFMTKYDWPLAKNSIGIYKLVKNISENKNISGQKEVIFPMVDFQDKWDIEELKWWSLSNNTEKANIAEAKYFHRFRMNETWARAEAAAATSVTKGITLGEPYKIDWPFLVWIETKNWEIPFAAKIWINDMKNPGSLGDMKNKVNADKGTTEMKREDVINKASEILKNAKEYPIEFFHLSEYKEDFDFIRKNWQNIEQKPELANEFQLMVKKYLFSLGKISRGYLNDNENEVWINYDNDKDELYIIISGWEYVLFNSDEGDDRNMKNIKRLAKIFEKIDKAWNKFLTDTQYKDDFEFIVNNWDYLGEYRKINLKGLIEEYGKENDIYSADITKRVGLAPMKTSWSSESEIDLYTTNDKKWLQNEFFIIYHWKIKKGEKLIKIEDNVNGILKKVENDWNKLFTDPELRKDLEYIIDNYSYTNNNQTKTIKELVSNYVSNKWVILPKWFKIGLRIYENNKKRFYIDSVGLYINRNWDLIDERSNEIIWDKPADNQDKSKNVDTQTPTVSAEQAQPQAQPVQPAQPQAPTDQNLNQNPEPVPETSSISANYSENIQKADNWDNSDNNWIINDLIWIKQEKGIQSLKNMNSENIKTLLEEFKENFKFKNMKERNPKWVQVTLWVQVALSILWYSAGTIDGYYWPNTTNAVKEFQKNNNLKIDWIAWSETISKIIELLDKKSS